MSMVAPFQEACSFLAHQIVLSSLDQLLFNTLNAYYAEYGVEERPSYRIRDSK